jgi:hypothetical protein
VDLALYGRVLRRFWYVLLLGTALAVVLAVGSYYNVSLDGKTPTLTPRAKERWQSQATLFLTEPGFPAGRRTIDLVPVDIGGEVTLQSKYSDPNRYVSLTSLYARLAESDQVRALMNRDGALQGSFQAIAAADTTYGKAVGLPMLSLFGSGSTPEVAEATVTSGMNAFLAYLKGAQVRAQIEKKQRVVVTVLNQPQPATLIVARKKTLPFVVFFAVIIATFALAFVLQNVRPTKARVPERRPEAEQAIEEIRRLA